MVSRKKRLKKQIEGLLKQEEKHIKKTESLVGRKDTTRDYWLGEAERFRKRAEEREEMLKKLGGENFEEEDNNERLEDEEKGKTR